MAKHKGSTKEVALWLRLFATANSTGMMCLSLILTKGCHSRTAAVKLNFSWATEVDIGRYYYKIQQPSLRRYATSVDSARKAFLAGFKFIPFVSDDE